MTSRTLEVICNNSPVQYLYQLGLLELLPGLYSQVTFPSGVVAELLAGRQGGVLLPEVKDLSWVRVETAPELPLLAAITDLGRGEREALALATRRQAPLVTLDDGLGRQYAKLLSIPVTGTLGVLLKGKQAGLVQEIRPLLAQLEALHFWLAPGLRQKALALAGET